MWCDRLMQGHSPKVHSVHGPHCALNSEKILERRLKLSLCYQKNIFSQATLPSQWHEYNGENELKKINLPLQTLQPCINTIR